MASALKGGHEPFLVYAIVPVNTAAFHDKGATPTVDLPNLENNPFSLPPACRKKGREIET